MSSEAVLKEKAWGLYTNGITNVDTCVRKALTNERVESARYVYLAGRLTRFLKAKIARENRKKIGGKGNDQLPKSIHRQMLEDARKHEQELRYYAHQD